MYKQYSICYDTDMISQAQTRHGKRLINKPVQSLLYVLVIAVMQMVFPPTVFGQLTGEPFLGAPPPSPGPAPVPATPATPVVGSSTPSPAAPKTASGSMAHFDPQMDNHLIAPKTPMGLFGLPISEVESVLRTYGARPYSYAFGKYSRMSFSVYLLTLWFDRNRRLGELVVTPKPPISGVETQARSFLLQLFLKGADLSQFTAEFAPGTLRIKYVGTARKAN